MAIPVPDLPQYRGPRMAAMPHVSASAEAFGAGQYRDLSRLAAAGQHLGLSVLARAQAEQQRLDQACVRDSMNKARLEVLEGAAAIYAKNGQDAENAPAEMEALLEGVKRRYGAAGDGGNIERQRMFEDAWGRMSADYSEASVRHRQRQRSVFEAQTFDAQNAALLDEYEAISSGRDIITGTAGGAESGAGVQPRVDNRGEDGERGLQPADVQQVDAEPMPQPHVGDELAKRIIRLRENVASRYSGSPAEYIKIKQDEAENVAHSRALASIAADSPEKAIEYLNEPRVKETMLPAVWRKQRDVLARGMIAAAKKQSENGMRQLGIQLGDKYDHEYEIIDALRGVEDRDLAKIAREEAETVRKARLAMGNGKGMMPEEKARDDRLAREQAKTLLKGADADSPEDDIEDEDGLDLAMDEFLVDETEIRRDKVRKYAVAELKAKRARQAMERRTLDQEAMQVMAASGWAVAAIDKSWPEDLQDKMLDRIEKREAAAERRDSRVERAAKKAKGVEYLEMPLDRLNEEILAGKWLDIVDEVGAETPEHAKLERRLKGEDKGGLTMLQYARNEFARLVGDPNKNKKKYAEFIGKVDESRTGKTKELNLNNLDMIPAAEQKKIINELLIDGDFRYWEWSGYLSPNRRRFEVKDEELPKWKPYDAPPTYAGDVPAFARPYFGPRDRRRDILPNGSVLIESANGTVTIVRPDGSQSSAVPKGAK